MGRQSYTRTATDTATFKSSGGRATGTYALNTGNYGLTIMPPVFGKIMGQILINVRNTFAFKDHISLSQKGQKGNTWQI